MIFDASLRGTVLGRYSFGATHLHGSLAWSAWGQSEPMS